MNNRYAGIGSRRTPFEVLIVMQQLAQVAALNQWTLRSGAAPGADSAFESGCDAVSGEKEIFLPWAKFNKHPSSFHYPTPASHKLASEIHARYSTLSFAGRSLIARNMQQILGQNLDQPVRCVICWTPDGCETIEAYGSRTGGTGSAIALASSLDIPVFNLYIRERYEQVVEFLQS